MFGLSDNADRIEIETQLDKNLIKDIQKIENLLPDGSKELINTYLSKYEIRCIKSVFRKIYSGNIADEKLDNVQIWTTSIFKRIKGINDCNNFEEFLNILNKTPYYKVFKKYEKLELNEINIFEIENELDIMYFNTILNIAKRHSNKSLNDIIGTRNRSSKYKLNI